MYQLDEKTQEQVTEVRADDRVVPTPAQKLDAVRLVVEALEVYSDEARTDILDMARNLLRPSLDRHEFAMQMIEGMNKVLAERNRLVAAVEKHRQGSSSQVRNVDRELWETFEVTGS